MKRLLLLAVILGGCTFDPDLGYKYFPCRPDGTCPGECQCLDGQVCVPKPGQELKLCAWCPEGQTICYQEETADCARLLSDPEHCGTCNHPCPVDFVCEYGACMEWCRDGLIDCDGACVDIKTDPYNCGDCGYTCGAGKVCSLGRCEAGCPEDAAECDGACVDVLVDPANCGGCGNPCRLPNATANCIEGACVILECLNCFQDCDQQDQNGCETCPETDSNNCGECGNVCDDPPPPVCEGDDLRIYLDTGDCISSECDYQSSIRPCNWGCENDLCKEDPCLQVTCRLHQRCEDGICVCEDLYGDCDTNDLNGCETYLSTVDNCGECGFSCGEKGICTGGVCDCDYGFEDCNGSWSDGCETDILLDEQNCGGCRNPCGANLTCCDGTCVDTNTDRGNCGGCMTFCAGMTECCLGTCKETQLDPENCGSCGNICQAPTSTCCYTVCVDTINDAGNCGECGNGCAIYIPCHQGTCGNQGIFCGDTPCDFWQEECCYGANGIACYPTGSCSTRRVECDDDSDCDGSLHCCLVDNSQYITQCTASCPDPVCPSDAFCADVNPAAPHCCAGNFYGQNVNTCISELCQ